MLMVFSVGVDAKIKVDLGGEKNDGVYPGGTIVEKSQTEPNANGLITVTITVTPHKGFTIKKTDIVVVSTYSPEGSGTRSPRIAGDLTLLGTDPKDPSEPRDYTFVVGSSLGAWIKEANFQKSDNSSKGPVRSSTISSLGGITDPNGSYILASNFSTTGTAKDEDNNEIGTSTNPFKGTIDGGLVTITGTWNKPLFDYVEDATIKNVIIGEASINITTASTNVGAIAANAKGETRIYNCGILGGSVSGTKYVGGIVGHLYDKETNKGSRVINCFSYADVSGGTEVAGIVGYNNYASTASDIRTMVMNCMFYGDITGSSKVSPVYGGENINNLNSGGLNTFNYYSYENAVTFRGYPENTNTVKNKNYNCALAVEEKYLNRFEFYRLLLNSNKTLAAIYATKSTLTVNSGDMAKWVLETADRTISSPKPYPILKAQGKYPSIINIDATHSPRNASVGRNKGCQLGKLSVTISESNTTGGGQTKPTGATVETTSLTLVRTDKDEDRFNFNYDKVQLPYYNDVGTKNYTGNKVVTGWKITSITSVANDPYTDAYYPTTGVKDFPYHNYADRKSSNKDLYSVSKRVFSQGAYFDVPYGVTSITIEPYWGQAAYVADEYVDVVCKSEKTSRNGNNRNDYVSENVTNLGKQYDPQTITVDGSTQTVHTTISSALGTLSGSTVYDNAVVLVGNLHTIGVPSNGSKAFTMMSVDLNKDNEPDFSYIFCDNNRSSVSPIRFDFLNIPGTAQAQKPSGSKILLNAAIFKTKGWFEITNTALMYLTQFEYENLNNNSKTDAPLILLGGYIDQFVSTQSSSVTGKTIYIHVGSNVLINSFGLGTHGDGSKATPHVPVSVTGGDYKGFYLTGTYTPGADINDDNAECYISGGRFGELAGAAQEQIGSTNSDNNGNIHWQIYDADITEFFGGGINGDTPVQGNITTDIFNSHVTTFCGGPKFGNMASGKKVTTTAEGCVFGKFFGAGYGGNSYSRKKYYDSDSYNFSNLQNYYINDRGLYFDGATTNSKNGGGNDAQYGKKGKGVATDFDYELFPWTSGQAGARFFVKFVTFSLAQCNDVESTLKKCIINNSFYGGGSLGKVIGTATSTLEDCTVTGNVFGAGYSATLPTIKVRNGGFSTIPKFNENSGMYEPGVPTRPIDEDLTGTTEYDWKHMDTYPADKAVGFLKDDGTYDKTNGTKVVTTVDISKTNLGSVGSAILTLQGNTTVGGSVYGGGEQSTVNGTGTLGNTKVTLKGNTHVTGNVFGGGDSGSVSGSTTVNIEN